MIHVYRTGPGMERGTAHKETAHAVVILGAAVRPDGSPSVAMKGRVRAGVALVTGLDGAALVLSGGFGKGHEPPLPTEARVMADLARAAGLPDVVPLWLEEYSRNTLENAAAVSVLLGGPAAPGRVTVVTDTDHLPRAMTCFRAARRAVGAGWTLNGHGVPVPERRAAAMALGREAVARLLYRARLWRGGMLAAVRAARHHAPPSATERE
jgi:hypothetical protein